MKRFVFAVILVLLLAVNCFAAWTHQVTSYKSGNDIVVRVYSISDGSDPAAFLINSTSLSRYLNTAEVDRIKGKLFWEVETIPVVQPDSTWTVAFTTINGAPILSLTGLSAIAKAVNIGTTDLDAYHSLKGAFYIDYGDIGSAADSVIVEITCK